MVAIAGVIDRCSAPRAAASVSHAMSAKSMSARRPTPRVSAQYVSAAGLTTPVVSSKRISRDRHATERDRDSDSNDRFIKHDFLQWGSSRQCRQLLIVAGRADTFACETTMRFRTFEQECGEMSNSIQTSIVRRDSAKRNSYRLQWRVS